MFVFCDTLSEYNREVDKLFIDSIHTATKNTDICHSNII